MTDMPLIDYSCGDCDEVTERLIRDRNAIPESVSCQYCGSENTTKVISRVHFKMHKRSMYSEDFMEKALPAMKQGKDTSDVFQQDGDRRSDEAKMFELSEQVGKQIDRTLTKRFPKK